MCFLDVTEAADVLGHAGNLHRQCEAVVIQAVQQYLHGCLVITDQLALHATLLGAAKHVEAAATQELQLGQQAERLEHPRAIFLLQQPALFVLLREQRRCQMEAQLVIALELLLQAALEIAAGVQAGHFVLVLVRHQLEQVAGHGLGQRGGAADTFGFSRAHAFDQRAVAVGVGGILVVGQEGRAALDHLVQRA
ncbi:hypothetical protein D3C73_568740 [compost metagenome]